METNPLIIIGIISAVVILSLVLQVALQRRKIRELERPRFGFLGKPLAVIAITGILAGSVGFGIFYTQQPSEVSPISADRNLQVRITYFEAPEEDSYTFKAIPFVDGTPWDNNPSLAFDIFWTVKNEDGSTKDFAEPGTTLLEPSSITIKLDRGSNEVTAKVVIGGRVVSESVIVEN